MTDAAAAKRLGRLQAALKKAKAAHARLETRLGYMMTQRADLEDLQAKLIGEIQAAEFALVGEMAADAVARTLRD